MPATFLTGATGFIGSEVLRRLLVHEPERQVHALVRAADAAEAARRGREVLFKLFFDDEAATADGRRRIHWVIGNLKQPGLGLAPEARGRILAECDEVIHAAASTDWDRPLEAAEAVNVEGVRAVVELAAEAARTERLLAGLGRRRFPGPESLIRFHEALLFLRAFPASGRVARRAGVLLSAFGERVEKLRRAGADLSSLDPMEVSGFAGTVIEDKLNYDVARWLVRRFPRHVEIVWDDESAHTRLAATLPRFLPLLDDDAYVEADVPYLDWLRAAKGRSGSDLAWLLSRFERLPLTDRERAELFDSLDLTIRWDLDDLRASRTRNWRSARRIFSHDGPFVRRNEVDLFKEMTAPLAVTRLSRREGERVLDLMREVMTVRRRELWGTTYGDPGHVIKAEVGRGLEIFLWGLPPERRLPLRAYVAGFSLKNGVPINYVEAIGLFEWMEVGFNTFYTFRDGESAWNYAQALRVLHQVLGMTCVSVYPYQIGQDNEEAIESGAFWFYRKLGFEVVAEVPDHPRGHSQLVLRKRLG